MYLKTYVILCYKYEIARSKVVEKLDIDFARHCCQSNKGSIYGSFHFNRSIIRTFLKFVFIVFLAIKLKYRQSILSYVSAGILHFNMYNFC